MAKGVRWLRMVGVDEGMERVGGGVKRVEDCIGGVWGWSIRGQSIGRGVRGWGREEHRRRAWSIGGGWSIG